MVKYGTVSYFTKHVQIAEYDLMISDAGLSSWAAKHGAHRL